MANRSPVARARVFTAHVVALVVSLLVTACGSGDSRSGGPAAITAPTTPVSITVANGDSIAAVAMGVATGVATVGGMLPIGVVADVEAAPAKRVVSRITQDALRRVSVAASAAQTVTGLVQSEACLVSGSVTISDTGTSASITFNQCSDYEGEVVNGTVAVTDYVNTADVSSGAVSFDVTWTASGATIRFVASFNVHVTRASTSSTLQMTGSYLGYTDGVTAQVLSNFAFSDNEDWATGVLSSSSSYTVASTALGGAITVTTPTPFQTFYQYAYYPHAGQIVIVGAGGSKLRLTVLGAASPQVRIEVDEDGDGTYDWMLEQDWIDLAAG